MKSIIHVNQHHIKANRKDGGNRPVFTIKQSGKTVYAQEVEFVAKPDAVTRFVYRPDQPLSCGAHVWVETELPLVLKGKTTFAEIKAEHEEIK